MQAIKSTVPNGARKNGAHQPMVIELVGLAGAGKSTLTKALTQAHQGIQSAIPLKVHQRIAHEMRHTLSFVPSFVTNLPRSRWFTRQEMRSMVYLTAWYETLQRQQSALETVQLLDLGPAYRLATLCEFGSPLVQTPGFTAWTNQQITCWQQRLDLLVWLDAPNPVLLERINTRAKEHPIKAQSQAISEAFLNRYRDAIEAIIGRLSNNGGPQIVHIDSERYGVEEIVTQVQTLLATHKKSHLQTLSAKGDSHDR